MERQSPPKRQKKEEVSPAGKPEIPILDLPCELIPRIVSFLDFHTLLALRRANNHTLKALADSQLERHILEDISRGNPSELSDGPDQPRLGWTEAYASRENFIETIIKSVPIKEGDKAAARERLGRDRYGHVDSEQLSDSDREYWAQFRYKSAVSSPKRGRRRLVHTYRPRGLEQFSSRPPEEDSSEDESDEDDENFILSRIQGDTRKYLQFALVLLILANPSSIHHAHWHTLVDDNDDFEADSDHSYWSTVGDAFLFSLKSNNQKVEIIRRQQRHGGPEDFFL